MNAALDNIETVNHLRLRAAYDAALPDILALDPSEIRPVNLDIMSAMVTTRGVVRELEPLREKLLRLTEFSVVKFERLEQYALAAAFAHTRHLVAVQPPDDLQALMNECLKVREVLLAEVTLLVKRGVVSGEAVRDLRGANGYRNVATDMQMLLNILDMSWDHIEGKSATTKADIAAAEELVSQLSLVVGVREQGPAGTAKSAELRERAFSLFTQAYDEVRRGVTFLRWHERDADAIIPSLYKGRGGRRRTTEESEIEVAVPGAGTTATPANGTVAASGANVPVPSAPVANGTPTPGVARSGGPFMA